MKYILANNKMLTFNGKILGNTPTVNPILLQSVFIAELDPWHVTLSYDKTINVNYVPLNSDYTVTVNSVNNPIIGISILNNAVYLELTTDINSGDEIFVSYSGSSIRSTEGAIAATFTDMPTPNEMEAPFSYFNAELFDYSPNKVKLYGGIPTSLDTNYIPASSVFSITDRNIISAVPSDSNRVLLNLNLPYTQEEMNSGVNLGYIRPRENFLRDTKGAVYISKSEIYVSYQTTGPSNVYAVISENPRIINIFYTLSDGAFIDPNYVPDLSAFTPTGFGIVDVSVQSGSIQLTTDRDLVIEDSGNITITYTIPVTNYLRYDLGHSVSAFNLSVSVFQTLS